MPDWREKRCWRVYRLVAEVINAAANWGSACWRNFRTVAVQLILTPRFTTSAGPTWSLPKRPARRGYQESSVPVWMRAFLHRYCAPDAACDGDELLKAVPPFAQRLSRWLAAAMSKNEKRFWWSVLAPAITTPVKNIVACERDLAASRPDRDLFRAPSLPNDHSQSFASVTVSTSIRYYRFCKSLPHCDGSGRGDSVVAILLTATNMKIVREVANSASAPFTRLGRFSGAAEQP